MKSTLALLCIILGLFGLLLTGSITQGTQIMLIVSLACIATGIILTFSRMKYKVPPRS